MLDEVLSNVTHYKRPEYGRTAAQTTPAQFREEMSWPPVLVIDGCTPPQDFDSKAKVSAGAPAGSNAGVCHIFATGLTGHRYTRLSPLPRR